MDTGYVVESEDGLSSGQVGSCLVFGPIHPSVLPSIRLTSRKEESTSQVLLRCNTTEVLLVCSRG